MLSVSQGRLLIDAAQCREVGWNCYYEFLKTLADNEDLSYQDSLSTLSGQGVRVIRCFVTPHWSGGTGGWASYDTATGMSAGFYTLLDAFMDECETNGIQVVMPLFWRHATIPDLFSESVSNIGVLGSSSLNYMTTCATEIVARYKDHAACGAWQVGNEWVPHAQAGTLPSVNVPNGTPASYSDPDDVITEVQCKLAIKTISDAIRAADPDRAILGAASRPLTAVQTTSPKSFKQLMISANAYNAGSVDVCGVHLYPDGHYGTDGYYALREYCTLNRNAAVKKPVVVDEVGISESFSGDFDASWVELQSFIADPKSPELILLWNWGDYTSYANGDTDWDVYPGVNREYQATAVRQVQGASIGAQLASGPEFIPSRWCRFGGGTSTPDCVYFPSGTVAKSDDWTLCFWLRYLGPETTSGSFFHPIAYGDESTSGFTLLRNSAGGRIYVQIQLESGAVNNHNRQCPNVTKQWMHHSVSWNSSTKQVAHYINGRYTSSPVTHGTAYVKGGDAAFIIGANKDLGEGLKCDIYDVRLYDSALSLPDMWKAYANQNASVDPVFRVLYNGIDSSLSVQGSPAWSTWPARDTVTDRATVTTRATVTNRATVTTRAA